MANASTKDARAGWEIFRTSGYSIEHDRLNQALSNAGMRTISTRTYQHYRNLHTAGYERYVSINRFDVARASRPYEGAGASSRYGFTTVGTAVRLTFPRGRRIIEAFGRSQRIGEFGVVVVFENHEVANALVRDRPRIGESAGIDFLDPPRHVDARIVEFEHDERAVRIELEFSRLESVVDYVGREPMPVSQFRIRLLPSELDINAVDIVGRQLFYFFEVIEAARAVVNEASSIGNSDTYAEVANVVSLQRHSPLELVFAVAPIVTAVTGLAFPILGAAWGYQRIRLTRFDAANQEAVARINKARAEVEEVKSEVQVKILRQLNSEFDISDDGVSQRLKSLIERDLIETTGSLAESGVNDTEITESSDDIMHKDM